MSAPQEHEWPEMMVPSAEVYGPDFPSAFLPEPFRGWTETVASSIQVPKALVALLELGLVGAACAKVVVVRMSESHYVPVNVWALVGLDSGERKSAAFREALLPVSEWEARRAEAMRGEVAEYEAEVRLRKKSLARAEEAAVKAGSAWVSPEAQAVKRIAREVAELEAHPVVMPKFARADVTPEAAVKILAEQGRLLLASPEGIVFDQMSGRYSQREMPNLDIFLMGYSGDDYSSERKGSGSIAASRPALSMALTTQPEVIAGLGRREGFSGRGIIPRFWYGVPRSLVGYRNGGDPRPIDAGLRANRDAALLKLLDLSMPEEPHVLELGADALRLLLVWGKKCEERLRPEGDLYHVKAWGTRVEGGTGRLCGILHMMEHAGEKEPWRVRISESTVCDAMEIMDCFLIPNALAAMGAMRADPASSLARYIMEAVKRMGRGELARREIQKAVHSRVEKPAALEAALGLLTEWGVVLPLGTRQTGGRPSGPFYAINPALLAERGAA